MNTAAYRKNIRKLMFMLLLVALAGTAYMLVGGGIYFLYLLPTNRRV